MAQAKYPFAIYSYSSNETKLHFLIYCNVHIVRFILQKIPLEIETIFMSTWSLPSMAISIIEDLSDQLDCTYCEIIFAGGFNA